MNFGLLIIGDEILSGKREDQHLPKVIEVLNARGLSLAWARYAGDERSRITADLRDAFASGDVVFSCGGIGATPDDHTRQCAAAALDRPLVLHPLAKELITQRMREVAAERGVPFDAESADSAHRLNMGVFPEGAEIVPNPYNKIPGFSVGTVFFVPGFPVMAWPMIEWVLDVKFAGLQRGATRIEKSIVIYGTPEASLTALMEALEVRHPAVRVFSLPSVDHPTYGRHLELGVKGPRAETEIAYADLLGELRDRGEALGPELVR